LPVSRALEVRSGIANDDLRQAVLAINRVHGDGDLPPIPVSLRNSLVNAAGESVDGLLRVEHAPRDRLMARSIQIRGAAPHRSLVVIHEVGHFLDVHALPGPTFASSDERVTVLTEWRRAVGRSRAVQTLRELVVASDAAVRNRAARLFEAEELWARSYVQFVTTRSRDTRLQLSLNAQRRRDANALYFPRQWEDDDFAEIDAAIERLFWRLGWIA
jgi:hypothetical protein